MAQTKARVSRGRMASVALVVRTMVRAMVIIVVRVRVRVRVRVKS